LALAYIVAACTMPCRFAEHLVVSACRRTRLSVGRRIEINKAMIPMTTRSSTSVNARARRQRMKSPPCHPPRAS